MEQKIKAEFRCARFVLDEEEKILKKCLTLCMQYDLTPSDLVSSFDIYSIMNSIGLTVKNAHMDGFSLHLQNEKEPGMHLYSHTDVTMIPDDEPEDFKGYNGPFDSVGKSNGGTQASGQKSVSVTPFGQQKSKFVVQSTLNALPKTDTPFDSVGKSNGGTHASGQKSVSVTPFGQQKSKFVVQSTLNALPKTDTPFDSVGKSNGGTQASGQKSVSVTPFGQQKSKFVVQSTLNALPKTDTPFDSVGKSNGGTHASGQKSVSVTPFGQRKSKFFVQSTLKTLPKTDTMIEQDQHMSEDDFIRTSSRCSLVLHSTKRDKIKNKCDVLENRILKFGETLVASGLCEELVDPTIASQESVCAVGMICCEYDVEKTILLQCSVKHSGGQRVRLDLQQLSHFSIFPGQIVGIQGHNPIGHCFIVSKIINSMPPLTSSDENLHPSKKQAVESTDPSHARADLSLIIAAGPFTTTDNLFFEPLTELLAYARIKQPQLLILLGPFVDSKHPEIRKGFLERTYDQVFHDEIIGRLRDYVEYMGSAARVILVPSVRDASHALVFPQPPFKIDRNLKNQITCVTNPGVFSANKVKIACCTTDVLLQLSSAEISGPQRYYTPRINRVASHLISQRSFYPLYPPAENVPLDLSLAPEALEMSSVPDILILPSVLTCFVKVLSVGEEKEGEKQAKCIYVNPGRLARGEGAGFFAEINYHESPELSQASVLSI